MLEKLLSYLRSGLDDDPFVRLDSITFDPTPEMTLSVLDYHGVTKWSEWKIIVRGLRDYRIVEPFGDLQFEEDGHVLARQHTEHWQELLFNGAPPSAQEAVGRFLIAHIAAAGAWIPFDRYLNSCCPIEDLLKSGSGKLADGPRFLIDAYSLALGTLGLRMTALAPRSPKFWNGQAWIVQSPEDAEKAAEALRRHWRLGDLPIRSVTTAIEDSGGVVLEVGRPDQVFDGLCGWADETIPVVAVSPCMSDDRRRFSLAHELGHLYMIVSGAGKKAEERLAHRFAAAFLVPASTARRELGERRRHLDLSELALLERKHGLSMQAWIIRTADLGIIDQGHARTLFAYLSAKGWRKEEPVAFHGRERPLRLRQLAIRALAEGLRTRAQVEQLCPRGLEDLAEERPPVPGRMDPRTLAGLSTEERDRLMEQAAKLSEQNYREGGLTAPFPQIRVRISFSRNKYQFQHLATPG